MLRRCCILAVAVLGASFIVLFSSTAANAACHYERDPDTGTLTLVCDGGDTTPGGGDDGDGDSGGSETCTRNGRPIPCSMDGVGAWNGECYVTPTKVENQPPPPAGKTEEDGAWYYCIYPTGGGGTYTGTTWVDNGTTFIDPIVLAYRAIAQMDLDPITIGIVPESGEGKLGLIGLPAWMWVENPSPDTWGPITASASEGPVSVTATATATEVTWYMGDGTVKTCGKGTPYRPSFGKQSSPDCGHRYERTSAGQPGNAYTVTASTHWEVQWTGGGQSGVITFDLESDGVQIRVGELQVLVQ